MIKFFDRIFHPATDDPPELVQAKRYQAERQAAAHARHAGDRRTRRKITRRSRRANR